MQLNLRHNNSGVTFKVTHRKRTAENSIAYVKTLVNYFSSFVVIDASPLASLVCHAFRLAILKAINI